MVIIEKVLKFTHFCTKTIHISGYINVYIYTFSTQYCNCVNKYIYFFSFTVSACLNESLCTQYEKKKKKIPAIE